MTAQPLAGAYQFTSDTAAHVEEIINKLQELGSGTGVGANYYPAAQEIKLRFGDHAHGLQHIELAPQEIATVRAYMAQEDKPEFRKVRDLFADADSALLRAQDYVREQGGKLSLTPPRPA